MSPVAWLLCVVLYASTCEAIGLVRGIKDCRCLPYNILDCPFRGKTVLQDNELCISMEVVNLQQNNLRTFPDSMPPRLRILDVSKNDIAASTPELRHLSKLEQLDVSYNRLSDFDFLPEICSLGLLIATDNLISTITGPLQNCSRLIELRLAKNKIEYVPENYFQELGSLELLDMSGNPSFVLQGGEFKGLRKLQYLGLKSNEISELPADIFFDLVNLEILDLRYNNISYLPAKVFRSLEKLEQLYLQRNNLRELPASLLESQKALRKLVLDDNQLESLPRDLLVRLHQLEDLSARGNRLTEVPDALGRYWGPLRTALFSDNLIASPSEESLRPLLRPGLQVADLEGNPVRPEALAWLLDAQSDLRAAADAQDCACGTLSLRDVRAVGDVRLCVYLPCGDDPDADALPDWLAVVRAARRDPARFKAVDAAPRPRRRAAPAPLA